MLAYKLHLLAKNMNPNQHHGKFFGMYYGGIVLNLVCGIVYGIPIKEGDWIYALVQVMQLCILLSCALIVDAVRRLSIVKPAH